MASSDGGHEPHLGTDILSLLVATAMQPEYGYGYCDDYTARTAASRLSRNLRLTCRTLRDLVDAATTSVRLKVDLRALVGGGPPLREDCGRQLGRLTNLAAITIRAPYESEVAALRLFDNEDNATMAGLAAAGVARLLLLGLLRALPEGGMGRITELLLGHNALLSPEAAAAIGAALPRLQRLFCSLPREQVWSGRLLGTAVLCDLPRTLQHLDVHGGGLGRDGGAGVSSLTALTHLRFGGARGMSSGVCRHVSALTGLRSLGLTDAEGQFGDTYDAADVAALSSLAQLTRLHVDQPFLAEHLPLGHLTALLDLDCPSADMAAFEAALASPSLDRLQTLKLRLDDPPAADGGGAAGDGDHGGWEGMAATGLVGEAAAAAAAVLLPSLTRLDCMLWLQWPRQVAHLAGLLRRLPVSTLRRVSIEAHDGPSSEVSSTIAQEVLYPLLTPALARFTAVEHLEWNVACGWHQRLPLPCGTFADVVRAMPRLRQVEVSVGAGDDGEDGGRAQPISMAQVPQGGRPWLGDEALEALASQPDSQLRRVHLHGVEHVTAGAVRALLRLPCLRKLRVSGCPLVPAGQQAEEEWRQACQGRVEVTLRP